MTYTQNCICIQSCFVLLFYYIAQSVEAEYLKIIHERQFQFVSAACLRFSLNLIKCNTELCQISRDASLEAENSDTSIGICPEQYLLNFFNYIVPCSARGIGVFCCQSAYSHELVRVFVNHSEECNSQSAVQLQSGIVASLTKPNVASWMQNNAVRKVQAIL